MHWPQVEMACRPLRALALEREHNGRDPGASQTASLTLVWAGASLCACGGGGGYGQISHIKRGAVRTFYKSDLSLCSICRQLLQPIRDASGNARSSAAFAQAWQTRNGCQCHRLRLQFMKPL